MKTISVLITCHNRRETTLLCLKALMLADVPFEHSLSIYLVDDGSTDGTGIAIHKEYPEINIINGDGNLYWNRGMLHAWKAAAVNSPDFYLWLNDDTFLSPNALVDLLKTSTDHDHNAITVGSTYSLMNISSATYGGWNKQGTLLQPTGREQRCYSFNGNCVLIPKSVYDKLGALDPYYRHSFGDIDYGYRATTYGIEIWLASFFVGTCELHPSIPKWRDPKLPLSTRITAFYSPLGCNPFEMLHLDNVRSNFMIGIIHFITTHFRVIFPKIWKT